MQISSFVLSWSHYLFLMRIKNVDVRHFYEIESVKNNWGLKELKRQFDTALYERLALSTEKDRVVELSRFLPGIHLMTGFPIEEMFRSSVMSQTG